jgi:hypothetical protein
MLRRRLDSDSIAAPRRRDDDDDESSTTTAGAEAVPPSKALQFLNTVKELRQALDVTQTESIVPLVRKLITRVKYVLAGWRWLWPHGAHARRRMYDDLFPALDDLVTQLYRHLRVNALGDIIPALVARLRAAESAAAAAAQSEATRPAPARAPAAAEAPRQPSMGSAGRPDARATVTDASLDSDGLLSDDATGSL